MKSANWIKGLPDKYGIYWFRSDFYNEFFCDKTSIAPIIQVRASNIYYFDSYGSGPLNCYYNEKFQTCHHAEIELPKTWIELTCPADYGDTKRAWFKSPGGYIAFGLMERDAHGVYGDLIWANHPQNASVCGKWIQTMHEKDWYFSPIDPVYR